jgi:hypothetical protein
MPFLLLGSTHHDCQCYDREIVKRFTSKENLHIMMKINDWIEGSLVLIMDF